MVHFDLGYADVFESLDTRITKLSISNGLAGSPHALNWDCIPFCSHIQLLKQVNGLPSINRDAVVRLLLIVLSDRNKTTIHFL